MLPFRNSCLEVREWKSSNPYSLPKDLIRSRHPQNLFERRHPFLHLRQARLPERLHAQPDGLALDVEGRPAAQDETLDLLPDRHHFIEGPAPPAPCLVDRTSVVWGQRVG